jgi:2-polyprenyl-3-methyl-5-hydroxy-6-metoxy-1,4-benzoquinol methylase
MTQELDHNPRKQFDEAIQYAVQMAHGYLNQLTGQGISIETLKYLELGPGPDFAPQLVLASQGAQVTVADAYLAKWDPSYHPEFYQAFLERYPGQADAIKAVLEKGSYDDVISLVPEPAERLSSISDQSFNFVQSNAVLEHVLDIDAAVAELARVTSTGGIHAHQIDFRDHRDLDRSLDHLLLDQASYTTLRVELGGNNGTAMRMPEMVSLFAQYFWVWQIEINSTVSIEYASAIRRQLPPDSPYRAWPPQLLLPTGGRLWLVRKDDGNADPVGARLPRKASIDVSCLSHGRMARPENRPEAQQIQRHQVGDGARVEIGRKWSRFLTNLTVRPIKLAEDALRVLLDADRLDGKTFLDAGSGNGLFSLAARHLGASVHSFDDDPRAVACTRELRRRYFDDDARWRVDQRSVLDRDYLRSLGTFDVVCCSLNRTGELWTALDNLKPLVPIGGQLFIAINNVLTDEWDRIKRTYRALPNPLALAYAVPIIGREEWKELSNQRRNGSVNKWIRSWTRHDEISTTGMSHWHAWIDWMGEPPREAATLDELIDFYDKDGFRLTNLVEGSVAWELSKLAFTREAPAGTRIQSRGALARLRSSPTSFGKWFGVPLKGPFLHDAEGWKAAVDVDLATPPDETIFLVQDYVAAPASIDGRGRVIVAPPRLSKQHVERGEFFLVRGRKRVVAPPFAPGRGVMWKGRVSEFVALCERDTGQPSPLFLFENGRQLPRPHAPHDEIARLGGGRFSHWDEDVWFSALDGSDPNDNGREYCAMVAVPVTGSGIIGPNARSPDHLGIS